MNKKGFTLIELVVASMILVIAFTALSQIVVFSTTYFSDEYSESVAQEDIRLVATYIEKDIRRYVIDPTFYTSVASGANLTITFGNVDSGEYVEYFFNDVDTSITRTLYSAGTSTNSVVAQQIDSLTINLDTSAEPYVQIDIIAMVDDRVTNNDIHQKIYLRLPKVGETTSS